MSEKFNIKMTSKPTKIASGASRIPTSGRDSGTHSRSSSVSNLTTVSDARSDAGDTVSENVVDYVVGERVWVNGTKPGFIKFLGKTQFSPGIWAGVVLDEAVGKNDGSVEGVKYFQCEPKKGIFARPHRLTREAGSPPGIGDSTLVGASTHRIPGNITPSAGRGSLNRNVSPISPRVCSRLRLGEKVIVNSNVGIKTGILRYLGETDFAKGDWAGVELDQPIGKNDGTVAGKRYFECMMKHGLFAPLHKVSHAGGTTTPRTGSFHGSLATRNRSGSRDSLNSSISSCSTSRSSRVKLGITSLTNMQKATRGSGSGIMTNSRALEEAIKEKEQHIEQLLKERDLERAEVARAASQYEEAEKKLSELKESEEKALQLRKLYETAETERKSLEGKLCKDQRKLEDLQFRLEEELIARGDLEIQLQKQQIILKRLEDFAGTELGEKSHCIKQIIKGQEYLAESIVEQKILIENDSVPEKISILEKELQSILIEKNKLSSAMVAMQKQLSEAESAIGEREILLSSLKNTICEKDDQIIIMKAELKSALESVAQPNKKDEQVDNEQSIAVTMELRQKILSLNGEIDKLSALLKEKVKLIEENDEKLADLHQNLDTRGSQLLELQSNIKDLEVKLNKSEMEKIDIQKSLEQQYAEMKRESESMVSIIQEENACLKKENVKERDLSQLLKEKEVQIMQKETEVKSLLETIDLKDAIISELGVKTKSVEESSSTSIKESEDKVNMLQCELLKLREKSKKHESELEQEIERLFSELKIASEELKVKSDTVSNHENQISSLEKSLMEKESNFTETEVELTQLKEKCQLLTQEKMDNTCSLQQQLKKLRELECEINSNQEEIQNLQKEIERLSDERHSQLSEKDIEKCALSQTLEKRDEEILQVNSKLKHTEEKFQLMEKNNSASIDALKSALTKLKCDSEEIESKMAQELTVAREDYEKLCSVLNKKELELTEVKDALNTTLKSGAGKEVEISELQAQLCNFRQEVEFLSKDKTEGQILLQKQLSDLRSLTDLELKEKECVIDELKNELEKYEQLTETKDSEVNKKENEINLLKTIVEQKEMQFDELSKMIASSQTQLNELKQENNNHLALLQSKESYIHEFKTEQEKQLLQMKQALNEEVIGFQLLLKEKDDEIMKNEANILELTAVAEDYKKKLALFQSELDKSKEDKNKILQDSSCFHKEFSDKIVDLEDKYSKLLEEKDKLAKEELTTRNAKKGLESMRDALLQEKAQQQAIVIDREAKLEALQVEVTRMQAQFSQHKQELQQKLDVSEMELQAALELKNQLEVQHSVLEELQQELHEYESKCKKLELAVEHGSEVLAEKDVLQKTLADFKKSDEEKLKRMNQIENQKKDLEKMLESNQSLLQQKESELENICKQMKPLQKDTLANEKLKTSLNKLEEENLSLKKKISHLETSVTKENENTGVPASGDDQEKESLLSQIDFLNSIIVDMKQKNEELTKNLELQSTCWDESDINLNDSKKEMAPRLFCDICDMFDLHDTEDCPKQASFVEEEVPRLKVQGSRLLEDRPYCNTCEVFGHWTLDCNEPDTF